MQCWSLARGLVAEGPDSPAQIAIEGCAANATAATKFALALMVDCGLERSQSVGAPPGSGNAAIQALIDAVALSVDVDRALAAPTWFAAIGSVVPLGRDVWRLRPGLMSYAVYDGTATRPPCTNGVRWAVVLRKWRASCRQVTWLRDLLQLSDADRYIIDAGGVAAGNSTASSTVFLESDSNGRPVFDVAPAHNVRFYMDEPPRALVTRLPAFIVEERENTRIASAWPAASIVLTRWTAAPLAAVVVTLVASLLVLAHRGMVWQFGYERVLRHRHREEQKIIAAQELRMRQYQAEQQREGSPAASSPAAAAAAAAEADNNEPLRGHDEL
jgi:hypothetical protein